MNTYRGGRASFGACFRGLPRFPLLLTLAGVVTGDRVVCGEAGGDPSGGGGEQLRISSFPLEVMVELDSPREGE